MSHAVSPNAEVASWLTAPSGSRARRPRNAVLHERAKALVRLIVPVTSPSELWKVFPYTVSVSGHDTCSDGLAPRDSSAAEVITFIVEPGASFASSALS